MNIAASTQPLHLLARSVPFAYRKPREIVWAAPLFSEWMSRFFSGGRGRERGKKEEGRKFERMVLEFLALNYPNFCSSLPFRYATPGEGRFNFCIPDGWFYFPHEIVLVEVKLRHTTSAWFQMNNLYVPVLAKAFNLPVRTLEIVKWFEPEVRFPEKTQLYKSVNAFISGSSRTGVCLWGVS